MEQFGYTNVMQVPNLDKVVLNMGVGEAVNDRKKVELGRGRPGADRRPEADRDLFARRDRDLQAA